MGSLSRRPAADPTAPEPASPPVVQGTEGTSTRLVVRARPGAPREEVAWDEWRAVWVISVTAPAVGGAANRAVLRLVTQRLGLRPGEVGFERVGRSPTKRLRVSGLSEAEIRLRLARPV
ncbi:MAG: DUF167 domain-containing protein [Thermoplasmata archaeon]|nr:DUF167 domain-containing protein [Thermoplasmata archaeon]MCI4353918.1 DUF167 domain-containing protein [Thermoplasmata archaeon]